uniref:Coiled-coil domain-containing protein 153 n=1 Tax=Trypanosoma congolense (strain IL3000) TaxID=1068625 RepID=G0UWZ3_TRYCI|nr:conserved hypothetical protein [Trypanosoma congolense IL3000]
MPPKKAAPKKKAPDSQVIDEKQQTLELLKRQCQGMEQLLMLASEEIRFVSHESSVLERRIAEVSEQRVAEENTTVDKLNTVRRTTSTLANQLKQRIKSLEQSLLSAENENALIRSEIEKVREKKNAELKRLKDEADALRKDIGEKAMASAVLLKEVLLKST